MALGPPPNTKAIEKVNEQYKKMIVKMLGAIFTNIGSSICLKNACVLKPFCLASLKCSVGIIDQPEINNRTANGILMSMWPVKIPINP